MQEGEEGHIMRNGISASIGLSYGSKQPPHRLPWSGFAGLLEVNRRYMLIRNFYDAQGDTEYSKELGFRVRLCVLV